MMSEKKDGGPAFPHPVIDPKGTPLTQREQNVMERRDAGMSLVEVAADLGMTRERVRQIEARAKYKQSAKRSIAAGMSLHDWFAGKALEGLLASGFRDGLWEYMQENPAHEDIGVTDPHVAGASFRLADAMTFVLKWQRAIFHTGFLQCLGYCADVLR